MYPITFYVCYRFTAFTVRASLVDPATCCIYLFINNFWFMLILVVPGLSFTAFSDSAGSERYEAAYLGTRIAQEVSGANLSLFMVFYNPKC